MRSFASSDFEGDLDEPWPGPPSPLFAGPPGGRYGDARGAAFRGTRQWGIKGGLGLILAAFVVLYGGVVLLHRYDQAAPSSPLARTDDASKSVEGAIGSHGSAQPSQKLDDSVPPDMSIANLPPPSTAMTPPVASARVQPQPTQPQQPAAQVQAPAQMQARPPAQTQAPALTPTPTQPSTATVTQAPAPSQSVAMGSVAPPSTADAGAQQAARNAGDDGRGAAHARTRGPRGRAGDRRSQYGDDTLAQTQDRQAQPTRASLTTRTLDNVQARLAKNDLGGARASLSGILATDPRNGYALSLREQLASREQARDASLSAARACVVQSRWHCVWHNAGAALSIDASSTEAKALVDRAIIESGAATAPAGPGPDNVQVPMVQ
jgi:hypothetical protein